MFTNILSRASLMKTFQVSTLAAGLVVIFSDQIHDLVFGSDQIDTPSSHSDWTTKEGFEASGIESLNDHLNHYLFRKIGDLLEYETRPGVLVDPTKWDSEEEIEPYMLWAVEYLRDSIQQLGEQGCLNNDISSEGWVFEVREPVDGQTVLISEGLLIVPIIVQLPNGEKCQCLSMSTTSFHLYNVSWARGQIFPSIGHPESYDERLRERGSVEEVESGK